MPKDEKTGVLAALGDEIGQSVRLYFQPVIAVVSCLSAAMKKEQHSRPDPGDGKAGDPRQRRQRAPQPRRAKGKAGMQSR